MAMLRILGAVALLTISDVLPAFAQAAIQEPGAYAFYHPNADVLNVGRPSARSFYPMITLGKDKVSGSRQSTDRARSAIRG
jgi:hypothetical protein